MKQNYLFTSESVSEGHPDKICDQISDAVLDLYLSADPLSKVAVETMATKNIIVVAGEVRSVANISAENIDKVIRQVVKKIGYTQEGFNWQTVKIYNNLHNQSPDIAVGVDNQGAGDQGIMFGYAIDDAITDNEYMPAAIHFSHKILHSISKARHEGKLPDLLPDAKSQVTLEYKNGKPVRAHSIVVSTQHSDNLNQKDVRDLIAPYVIQALPDGFMCPEENFYVNPTGRFVVGGPVGDTGLTGRKIIVDTYGGYAPHGGGAFSGKDASKVDRSAAYIARYIAKNVVASEIATECLIQLSYAIGVAKPLSFYINTFGTSQVPEDSITKKINQLVDLTPQGIINHLDLLKPIYEPTATYGHFGRMPTNNGGFSWERTDILNELRKL